MSLPTVCTQRGLGTSSRGFLRQAPDNRLSPYFYTFMGPGNRFQGMNSASLCSLAGRYDNPVPPRFLTPYKFKLCSLVSCTEAVRKALKKPQISGKTSSQVGLEIFVVAIRGVVISLATYSHVIPGQRREENHLIRPHLATHHPQLSHQYPRT